MRFLFCPAEIADSFRALFSYFWVSAKIKYRQWAGPVKENDCKNVNK
jgi:hypothetical protein